jgi:hypothetical protein
MINDKEVVNQYLVGSEANRWSAVYIWWNGIGNLWSEDNICGKNVSEMMF